MEQIYDKPEPVTSKNLTAANPFPGLRSFDYDEHHLFFGREKNVQELLKKLRQNHFVAIVGTSGTGKSSLIRAGLLPAIHQGKLGDPGTQWLIASMKPGNTPVKNLAAALMGEGVFSTGDAANDRSRHDEILAFMSKSSLGLVQAARGLLTGSRHLLLLIDQFEEIFRFADDHADRNDPESSAFAQLIIDTVRQRDIPVYVILTLRSDFLGDCVRFEGLPEAINDGHYLVPRLTTEQSKSAITGPVDYARGKISPRLVQRVLNDLGDNPDRLPVLQHALMRTWECWTANSDTGEPMDLRHYEMIGGIADALSAHAGEAYDELASDRQKKLIQQVFKCLTVKTGDNRGIRRPTSVRTLMSITGATFEELQDVLHPFRKAGRTFILPGEEDPITPDTVLDISHESLMRGWDRLHAWADEEMESAAVYDRLCTSALLYREGRAGLWRDPELQMAIDWKEKNDPNPPWSQQYNTHYHEAMDFLAASTHERNNEADRKKRRTMIVRSSVASFLVIVTLLSAWALFQTKKATEKSILAEQKTTEALNQKQLAEKAKEMALAASQQAMDSKSYAELQARIADEQKTIAQSQKSKAEEEAIRALTQEQEALRQKKLAEENSNEALMQKQKADSSQSEATRLRMISIGQNVAFKSLQQKDDPQLAALLAYQSFRIIGKNRGNVHDPQLYAAMYNASQKVDPGFRTVMLRERAGVAAMRVAGGRITEILENGELKTYDAGTFKPLATAKLPGADAGLNTAYISEDGLHGAAGLESNDILVYDLANPGSSPRTLEGHSGLVRAVVFSGNGSTIASGSRDSSVIVWKNFAADKKVRLGSRVKALSFNEDESLLYIGTEDGIVTVYNLRNGEKRTFASVKDARVQAIRCSASGNLVTASFSNGTVLLLNRAGSVERTLNETGSVEVLSLDEKNGLLALQSAGKFLRIYRLSDVSLKPVEINCNSSIGELVLNDGEFVYVACADRTVRSYPVKASWFEKILSKKISRTLTAEEITNYIGPDVPLGY